MPQMPTLNYRNMSSSTPQKGNQSGGQGRRGQGRNGNRRRRSNSNQKRSGGQRRDRRHHGGGGGRSGGAHFSKMPRRAPKPSLWQRILAIFGLGETKTKKKPKSRPNRAANSGSASQEKAKPRIRTTVTKSSKTKRKPERVEVTSSRLYVGNLSYDATESDLYELFNGVGTVTNAEIVYNSRTQRSKGYAFISMMSLEEAVRAVDELHDKEYMGRKMVVSGAKNPKEREVA